MNTARLPSARRLSRLPWHVPALMVLGIAFTALLGSLAARDHRPQGGISLPALLPPEPGVRAPEFPKGVTWLNSPPLTLKQLRVKVVLVDFWEYTCVNCIRTFPYLKEWDRRYRDKGLVIVGVHTPEFAFARQVENVRRAAAGFGFQYPLAVDSDYKIWNAYDNHYWPAKYLIDKNGILRYTHFGEGNYGNTEEQI